MKPDERIGVLEDEMAHLINLIETEDDQECRDRLTKALGLLEDEYSVESRREL